MQKRRVSTEIEFLLNALDEGFDAAAWHGPSLRNSLRGVTPQEAAWRPAEGRHNIWEIIVHAAYWKYIVRRRLLREGRGGFPVAGSNWIPRPEKIGRAELSSDLQLLEEQHRLLREAVAETPPGRLDEEVSKSQGTIRRNILGAAFHDAYHAGQIQLLKRMLRESAQPPAPPPLSEPGA